MRKVPFITPDQLPTYISRPEDKGERLTNKAKRIMALHPGIGLCCGFVPDQKTLYELAEHYEGVLVMFKNITDEIVME